ncbi:hypothetical protein Q9314_08185 [Shinella sumterensis]|nr:hypothetical protein Q9314_08185 [Shinella sumterensis]
MASPVKKSSSTSAIAQFEIEFEKIKNAADDFNAYELGGNDLLYAALDQIFSFGEDIRKRHAVFEHFLKQRKVKLNKVTRENPYNALVELTFGGLKSKSWRSEISNVLAYASDRIGNAPFLDWIKDGGVKGRYEEAVEYFRVKKGRKTNNLRSAQLAEITEKLKRAPITPTAIPGMPVLSEGFHRSLVYSDGTNTFLVDIKGEETPADVEKYLLDLARKRGTSTHPLKDRPLFNLYRAVDLIAGTCSAATKGKANFIRFRNIMVDGQTTTVLDYVSDAYSFTHAAVTLAGPIAAFGENGTFLLELADAEAFIADFPSDPIWSIGMDNDAVVLADDSTVKRTITLFPISRESTEVLRQGKALINPSRAFTAPVTEMAQALASLPHFTRGKALPRTLSWDIEDKKMQLSSPDNLLLRLDFLHPFSAVEPLFGVREMLTSDLIALLKSVTPYGEDLVGNVADSDVQDAAFCIDHKWTDGDRFHLVSPFVISQNLDTAEVCEGLSK